jgi:membrane protein implicated in regulation of membrane protease activity
MEAPMHGPPPSSALRPYLLAQLPGWLSALLLAGVLHRWLELPPALAAALVATWVLKDLALYPLLKRFYLPATAPSMVGASGRVVTPLAPTGFVRIRGELWQARTSGTAAVDTPVRVRAVEGLVLVVDVDEHTIGVERQA